MSNNSDIGILASKSAHESLHEEKAQKVGAGKFWNIIHLLNELDYLRIQERQVRKPLDEAFITKALWWYYLQRGVGAGVLCATLLIAFRVMHVLLGFVIPDPVNNALLYMLTAVYSYYLSTYLIPMVAYHYGATTKAVDLVMDGGVGGLVMFGFTKSYVVFMLIYYQNEILWKVDELSQTTARWLYWSYQNVLGPGYVEICFCASLLIGAGAALVNYKLVKKDLKLDSKRGRPYNRVSQDR